MSAFAPGSSADSKGPSEFEFQRSELVREIALVSSSPLYFLIPNFTNLFFIFIEHGVRSTEYQSVKSKSREYYRGTLPFSSFEPVTTTMEKKHN